MSPEVTTAVSLTGAAFIALLPKLVDLILGARIAKKKDEAEREAAYRQTVFADAARVREERASFQAELLERIRALEERNRELEEYSLDDTRTRMRRTAEKKPHAGGRQEG